MAFLRKIAGGAALTLGSVVVTLALAEMVLRFTPYADLHIADYTYPADYFVADEELGIDIAPNLREGKTHMLHDYHYEVTSNRYGCFDLEREVPDDYTLVVGDSMTWGYAPLEHKWTTHLEALSGKFKLKCGVTGYGTVQALKKAQKVAAQVGKPPKRLIAMHIVNDINDDFFFPQRTVYAGKMISWVENLDLDTGEVTRRSLDEIARRNAKYEAGTVSNTLREWRHGLVVYRLFKTGKAQAEAMLSGQPASLGTVAATDAPKSQPTTSPQLPNGKTDSIYGISFAGYLDTDRPWFNAAVEAHAQNILAMAEYAESVGAKLLFVDTYGVLQHPRFDAVRAHFAALPNHHYYNLQQDYYPHDTWENDGHWNLEGNRKAAQFIHDHANSIGFFED